MSDNCVHNNVYIGDTKHISNIFNSMLYLGSQYATRYDTIYKRNITHIISIGCKPLSNIPSVTNHIFEQIEDNESTVDDFFTIHIPQMHSIIDNCIQNENPILVHCQAGISRSATVIITWLMKSKNMTYEEAYLFTKAKRKEISPNHAFEKYIESHL